MNINLGDSYKVSLLVTDSDGLRVLNDNPIATIKDLYTNKYWNGIAWSSDEARLSMTIAGNGVYSYIFKPNKAGFFEINSESFNYGIYKQDSLEVVSSAPSSYEWLTNNAFVINYTSLTEDIPKITVVRNSDNKYFNGDSWVNSVALLDMFLLQNNVYNYSFLPDAAGAYTLTVSCNSDNVVYRVNVSAASDSDPLINISNFTFAATDGSDSTVLDGNGAPIKNVKVSAYNTLTGEFASSSMTDAYGQWTMLLKKGNYLFLFEKDSYSTVSFERMVI